MFFQQLRTGDYFRIAGVNQGDIYRKASNLYCRVNGSLKRIHPHVAVRKLTLTELREYVQQQESQMSVIPNQ
jgi:hypothetical protein